MIHTNVQVDGHKYDPKQVENANACEPEASLRYTILDNTGRCLLSAAGEKNPELLFLIKKLQLRALSTA